MKTNYLLPAAMLCLAAALTLPFSACHATTSVSPPGAPAATATSVALDKAADAVASLADGLKLAHDAVKGMAAAQPAIVTPTEAGAIYGALNAIAHKNDAAIEAIRAAQAAGSATGWQAQLLAVSQAAATLTPATFNISNPAAKANFATALGVFTAASATIAAIAAN